MLIIGSAACSPAATPEPVAISEVAFDVEETTKTSLSPTETVAVESIVTIAPSQTSTSMPTATELPPVPTNTPTPTDTPAPTHTAVPVPAETESTKLSEELYAVVGVAPGDTLNVRVAAGVDSEIIGELSNIRSGIRLFGDSVMVDESEWVQVQVEEMSGWVNFDFLAIQHGTAGESAEAALEVMHALKTRDFATLSTHVHPFLGVRLTPYASVRYQDIVLNKDEVADIANNTVVFRWGSFDGTGDPIQLTADQYYQTFIYDVDFFQPDSIGFNESIGYSNDINNIFEFYPEAEIYEYYFPGFNERYDGMDWRGLRIVLQEHVGVWYLVGIVHTEWTI